MGQNAVSEAQARSEQEQRTRLVYWIKEAMRRRKVRSVAALARGIGAPESSLHRWLDEDGTAPFPMTYLGALCRYLRVDPLMFAKLDPIPADPLGPFLLEGDDLSEVVTDAARLALLDQDPEEGAPRVVGALRRVPPRTREPQGKR